MLASSRIALKMRDCSPETRTGRSVDLSTNREDRQYENAACNTKKHSMIRFFHKCRHFCFVHCSQPSFFSLCLSFPTIIVFCFRRAGNNMPFSVVFNTRTGRKLKVFDSMHANFGISPIVGNRSIELPTGRETRQNRNAKHKTTKCSGSLGEAKYFFPL